jgi:hypothetical protein
MNAPPVKFEDLPEPLRQHAAALVGGGQVTQQEVDDALAFTNSLADEVLAGRISEAQAEAIIGVFARLQAAGALKR